MTGAGLDIGSTTIKTVVIDVSGNTLFSAYRRHYSNIRAATADILRDIASVVPTAGLCVSGSGGLDLSRELGCCFLQEALACRLTVEKEYPDMDIILELGGEDAKITYLTGGLECRMNDTCAGGTGAFIDQMAAFLRVDASGLDRLAAKATTVYPIASRCGVFAKSDILPLLNEGCSRENIAASIIQAVANQTISGLAQGRPLKGAIIFPGGPFRFLPSLRRAFKNSLPLASRTVFPDNGQFYVALGAALEALRAPRVDIGEVASRLRNTASPVPVSSLPPLFSSREEYSAYISARENAKIDSSPIEKSSGDAWLGIDCGSTTVKCVLIDAGGRIIYRRYESGEGDPVAKALTFIREIYTRRSPSLRIAGGCATGYGGELIKTALNLDLEVVETIAHFKAAKFINPNVSFILDIGGQDIKCMSVRNGSIERINLNEACSAGCGSFIENLAESMNLSLAEFVEKALFAKSPVNLGARCAVFMNSRVRQAQKEGADVADIAAGLCYSVIRNALRKVIKINDVSKMGDNIVVQGGAFCNDAILRALELELGREAIRPELAGLTGAFGAALIARDELKEYGKIISPEELENFRVASKNRRCGGCGNACYLSVAKFSNDRIYISGNRCERPLAKRSAARPNLFAWKYEKLFAPSETASPPRRGAIGIPRALNIYENFPFWRALLEYLGFEVVVSPPSSRELYLLGGDTIPSQTVCYPAKLVHGHIRALLKRGVNAIFYPAIRREQADADFRDGLYNCPVVTGYPELAAANIPELNSGDIEFINDFLPLNREFLPKRLARTRFFKDIPSPELERATGAAFAAMENFRRESRLEGEKILRESAGEPVIILAGHPYHIDPEICGGVAELICSCGAAVLTADSVAWMGPEPVKLRAVNQWAYHSLLYRCAGLPAQFPNVAIIQLVSFGCGLDAIVADQTEEIVRESGGLYAQIKIDEGINLGQARIRVRSLLASMDIAKNRPRAKTPPLPPDAGIISRKNRKFLIPQMSPAHFQFAESIFGPGGYNVELLRETGPADIETGMKYVNNDACYPAILLVGQLLNAIKSGKYDKNNIALVLSQTGGICRATNYAALLRKALDDAGLPIPIAGFRTTLHGPGIRMDSGLVRRLIMAGHYGDAINRIVCRLRPYAEEREELEYAIKKWTSEAAKNIEAGDSATFNKNIWRMIREFDRFPIVVEKRRPRVGLVGEILLKYHPFANNGAMALIEAEGAEVAPTDIMDFMMYCLYREVFDYEKLDGSFKDWLKAKAGIAYLELTRGFMRFVFSRSSRFSTPAKFSRILADASSVISPGQQAGEGWLLGAEMVKMIKNGAAAILSLQPFGCLPNHIAAKGIIRRLKNLYPSVSVAALDYDPAASETNQLNRIKLLLRDLDKKNG
ncbi:MAG: acyl-CoA dehydratase activase [Desulfovibrio sp.]|nr:acyl-CoA dehydratase activase [Desulfovibrio sp.]